MRGSWLYCNASERGSTGLDLASVVTGCSDGDVGLTRETNTTLLVAYASSHCIQSRSANRSRFTSRQSVASPSSAVTDARGWSGGRHRQSGACHPIQSCSLNRSRQGSSVNQGRNEVSVVALAQLRTSGPRTRMPSLWNSEDATSSASLARLVALSLLNDRSSALRWTPGRVKPPSSLSVARAAVVRWTSSGNLNTCAQSVKWQ